MEKENLFNVGHLEQGEKEKKNSIKDPTEPHSCNPVLQISCHQ
jgi:hypothetical protein